MPAEIRRALGLGPGSVLEWDQDGGKVTVRRAGRYSSQEIHQAIFPGGAPAPKSVEEMKQGIRQYMRQRHARD